uniref:acid phosphatase n=1 Tax=Cacopsylla melanoneura TaxID=428564 RepID=A0A8D8YDS3_9HEMI
MHFHFEGKKSVLFLCRDNYMRSPMIKSMFMDLLKTTNQTDDWIVESAGIGWWDVGKGMDPRAKHHLESYGLNTSHIVREICQDDFYKFEYIIATDERDLGFLDLEAPEDGISKCVLLGSFNSKAKFPVSDLPDPFFLKTKPLNDALEDIMNRGYWYLVSFLDTFGVQVPEVLTTKKVKIITTVKIRSSTMNPWHEKMSSLQAGWSATKFKDRITVKSTHRKLQ